MAMNWSKWEAIRAKGPIRFVILRGVLAWGVSVAIVWSLAMWAISSSKPLLAFLLPALIFFPLGGILWGLSVWFITERKYAKFKQYSQILAILKQAGNPPAD